MIATGLTMVGTILTLLMAYYTKKSIRELLQWLQDMANKSIFRNDNSEASALAKKLKEANDKQKSQEGRG